MYGAKNSLLVQVMFQLSLTVLIPLSFSNNTVKITTDPQQIFPVPIPCLWCCGPVSPWSEAEADASMSYRKTWEGWAYHPHGQHPELSTEGA